NLYFSSGYYNPQTGTLLQGTGSPAMPNPTSISTINSMSTSSLPEQQLLSHSITSATTAGSSSGGEPGSFAPPPGPEDGIDKAGQMQGPPDFTPPEISVTIGCINPSDGDPMSKLGLYDLVNNKSSSCCCGASQEGMIIELNGNLARPQSQSNDEEQKSLLPSSSSDEGETEFRTNEPIALIIIGIVIALAALAATIVGIILDQIDRRNAFDEKTGRNVYDTTLKNKMREYWNSPMFETSSRGMGFEYAQLVLGNKTDSFIERDNYYKGVASWTERFSSYLRGYLGYELGNGVTEGALEAEIFALCVECDNNNADKQYHERGGFKKWLEGELVKRGLIQNKKRKSGGCPAFDAPSQNKQMMIFGKLTDLLEPPDPNDGKGKMVIPRPPMPPGTLPPPSPPKRMVTIK
ncbi:MAG: hypothetical protein KBC08_04680, partial [Caldisericia bacterium]|nr:hypothetical protein [Caldisericia bacterium]